MLKIEITDAEAYEEMLTRLASRSGETGGLFSREPSYELWRNYKIPEGRPNKRIVEIEIIDENKALLTIANLMEHLGHSEIKGIEHLGFRVLRVFMGRFPGESF